MRGVVLRRVVLRGVVVVRRAVARHLAALLCGALAVGLLWAPTADAQSWAHDSLVDADLETEQYSAFWESTLSGFDEDFQELLKKAAEHQRSSIASQREAALPLLQQAAKLKPEDARVHYALGNHYKMRRDWNACATAYGVAFALEPGFTKENPRKKNLGENLGVCLLYSEQFEGAVLHFRRLITQGHETAEVQLRFGEALMALGRLEEATFSFKRAQQKAQNHSRNLVRETEYALAVALDREERLRESRALMSRLTSRDSQLTTLRSTDKSYAPASEELYYLGLAYESQGNLPRALYSFRRFLSLNPDSPWASHAKSHLRRAAKPKLATMLSVSGSAQWPLEALRSAIRKNERSLNACVAGHPEVLVTLTLSSVLSRTASAHQARAAISAKAETDRDTLNKVVECLESAGRKIRMPKQSGLIGGHGTAQFTILGSP